MSPLVVADLGQLRAGAILQRLLQALGTEHDATGEQVAQRIERRAQVVVELRRASPSRAARAPARSCCAAARARPAARRAAARAAAAAGALRAGRAAAACR